MLHKIVNDYLDLYIYGVRQFKVEHKNITETKNLCQNQHIIYNSYLDLKLFILLIHLVHCNCIFIKNKCRLNMRQILKYNVVY